MPFVSEGILVSNFAVDINSKVSRTDSGVRWQRFFQSNAPQIFDLRKYDCDGRLFRVWDFWQYNGRIGLNSDTSPMPYFIRRSFSEILDFDKPHWNFHVRKAQFDRRNAYVGPQISNRRIFYLSDNFLGLLTILDHLKFLFVSNFGLPTKNSPLQKTHNNKSEIKKPERPINFFSLHRDRRKFGDFYLMIVLSVVVLIMWLGGLGLYLAFDRHRRVGWFLFGAAFFLNVVGCVGGALGCFPWHW